MASKRRITSYSAKLDKLECHYTWFKDHEWTTDWLQKIINKLEADLNLLPQLAVHHLTFLSYLYFKLHQLSTSQDIQKAFDYMDKAEKKNKEVDDEFLVRSDHVVSSSKLHLSYEGKQLKMEEDLNDLIANESSLDNHNKAAIYGLQGLAISRLGNPKYEEAIALFKKARELDLMTNPNWSYGIALYSGRRRVEVKGILNRIYREELHMWKESCSLTAFKEARYLAGYAFALWESSARCKNNPDEMKRKQRLSQRHAEDSLLYNSTTNDHEVYWLCAKTLKRLEMNDKFEECLNLGIEKCTRNHKLYHQLGCHYWKNKGNLPMAMECLQKVSEKETLGKSVFWANMDLLKLKIEMNDNYDAEPDFQRLVGKYCKGDNKAYFEIALAKEVGLYYRIHGLKDIANEKLLDAVRKESINDRQGAVSFCTREIEDDLKRMQLNNPNFSNNANLGYFYQHVKPEGWVPDSMKKSSRNL